MLCAAEIEKPSTCFISHWPGGGGPAVWATLTPDVSLAHSGGSTFAGDTVMPVTVSLSLPVSGVKPPENPAPVHAVRACATVIAGVVTSCGTCASSSAQPSGTLWVTVTLAVNSRHEPGLAVGDVVWVRTMFTSGALEGLNVPVNPAAVQAARASPTVSPLVSVGTSLSLPMQPAGTGSI